MKKKATKTKDIVKFHNDVNKVAFSGFSKRELSVFYSIAKILEDKQGDELHISFRDLRKTMNMPFENSTVFLNTLTETVNKLLSIHATIKKDNGNIVAFVPFIVFELMPREQIMRVRVNPEYAYLFNMLTKNFTYFELSTFNSLRTKYSQRLFSLLKQYQSTGRLYMTVEEFRRLLDVPEGYDMRKISAKILNPSIDELSASFPDLAVKKIRIGRSVGALDFTFRPAGVKYDLESKAEEDRPLCPHCGHVLVQIRNKTTGEYFYGHKDFKGSICNRTYNSLQDIEKDREAMQKQQFLKGKAEQAWDSVLKQQQDLFSTITVKKDDGEDEPFPKG